MTSRTDVVDDEVVEGNVVLVRAVALSATMAVLAYVLRFYIPMVFTTDRCVTK